jgi:hypothetical protein
VSGLSIYDAEGNAKTFAIVSDDLLPSGKRAIVRNYRATNVSDPSRIKTVHWEIWGPIGASKESVSGILSTDYVQNLDTRYPRRLLPKGARNAVTLTSKDPAGVSATAKLGEFKLGSVTNKLGGPLSTTANVTAFDEQGGRLFAHRGNLSTQVLISSWAVEATAIHPEAVTAALNWRGLGRVGLGTSAPMRTRTAVSTSGSVYEPTSTLLDEFVYAGSIADGSDRCWITTRNSSGELENLVSYTLDDFETLANPFPVGDPRVKANNLGPHGPFVHLGKSDGIITFTDQAKPVPLSRALKGHLSEHNGAQFADPGWGWLYAISDVGLRALTSHIDNPVGIGERMREFTGHAGRPTAIWPERGELFVVYQTAAGDSYGYRGVFGAQTAQTGQPDFYPWWYKASTDCEAIFSTNTPTDTAVVWGEGTNMAYETISRDGRDDTFTSRVYDITTGTWKLAWSFDGESYVQVAELEDDGFHTVRPVQELVSVPMDDISGRAMRPRLILDDTSSTDVATWYGTELDRDPHLVKTLRLCRIHTKNLLTCPEVAGTLEVEYDERPEYITEAAVFIRLDGSALSKQGVINQLEGYMSAGGPLRVRLPDDQSDRWAFVANVQNRRDTKGDAIEGIDVILHLWDVE